jgi:glycosyltransferase involved in cell wall biosynthesis
MTDSAVTSASVIIGTFNKREYLELTLASLALQDNKAFNIVVCDDGTTGGVRAIVAASSARLDICLVEQPNQGRASARNRALAAATGDIIIFSDDDRIADPHFVSRHVERHTASSIATIGWKRRCLTFWRPGALPLSESDLFALLRRGIVLDEPRRVLEAGDLEGDFDGAMERISLGEDQDNYIEIVAEYGDDLDDLPFAWVVGTTANLAVSRAALEDVGGFDEYFDGWGVEDADLLYRLYHRGVRFVVERGAVNHHQVHPLGVAELAVAQREQ